MNLVQDSEAGWVRSARNGDRGAFDRLVERYRTDAVAAALGLLGDREEAQDAVQQAFLSAWTGLASLREGDRFRAWLGGILYRVCLELRRRHARKRRLDLTAPPVPRLSEPLGEVVRETLALAPEFRDVLTLFYLQGLTIEELAPLLCITPGNAKVRLHRARRMLRERLQEEPS